MRSLLILPLFALAGASRADLLFNGDFSLGNVGFSSDHAYQTDDVNDAGQYAIGTDPQAFNQYFTSFGDHTNGTGTMMVVNAVAGKVWGQSLSLLAGTNYTLSYWARMAYPLTSAQLQTSVGGVDAGAATALETNGSAWQRIDVAFTVPTSGSYELAIRDLEGNVSGNDFALDDLSLSPAPVPEPASVAALGLGSVGLLKRRRRSPLRRR